MNLCNVPYAHGCTARGLPSDGTPAKIQEQLEAHLGASGVSFCKMIRISCVCVLYRLQLLVMLDRPWLQSWCGLEMSSC